MATDSRLRWVIRDFVPGDVTIGDPGPGYALSFRATVRVTATVINGSGGRSEVHFDAFTDFEGVEKVGDATALVVKGGIEGARQAARAFCDTVNAEFYGPPLRGSAEDVEVLRAEFAKGVPSPTWAVPHP